MLTKHHYLFKRILKITLSLLLVLATSSILAKSRSKRPPVYEFRFRLGTIYDDNILKYSDKYLERFMNHEDEGRFHIKTYDDLIIFTGLRFSGTFRIFGRQRTRIDLESNRRNYIINNINSRYFFSAGLRQNLPERFSFRVFYSHIPNLYVRHFRDAQWVAMYGLDDPRVFQPFSFTMNLYNAWIQRTILKNTRIRFSMSYIQYYHNKHYTEYDSKNWNYGIQAWHSIHKDVRLSLRYQHITSKAQGYDASYQTPGDIRAPDATYTENRFRLGLSWSLPRIYNNKHSLEGRIAILNRYYHSRRPIEFNPLHAGRIDKNLRLYFNYRINVHKDVEIRAFYNWFGRDSGTSAEANDQYVSNEKSYQLNTIGLEFTYNLRVKTKR